MGEFLNPGKAAYLEAVNSAVFVDKSGMLLRLNEVVGTKDKYVCVSRPRRFGKTYAADMVCAYYGAEPGARELFSELAVASVDPTDAQGDVGPWDRYLGAFDVVRITVTDFVDSERRMADCLKELVEEVSYELKEAYPDLRYGRRTALWSHMSKIYSQTGRRFVIVIDEWDAPMRERAQDHAGQKVYLEFLRNWLKDKPYIALSYMTGILPIKKYGTHSALNMFDEYTMAEPGRLAEYVGFTDSEVERICRDMGADYQSMRAWYDGYRLCWGSRKRKTLEVYNPLSVASAARKDEYRGFWGESETYEALAEYIRLDFDGLRQKVALMMDGGHIQARLSGFQNDMSTFHSADDVIALLVHLGYLGWDATSQEAFIPNREVMEVFVDSTATPAWELTFKELKDSRTLVTKTLEGDAKSVAAAIEAAHDRCANMTYNSEAALSYAIRLAYFAALASYTELTELDSGKGFVDVCYLPKPGRPDLPAIVVELKWSGTTDTAIDQIRTRDHPGRLVHYRNRMLLVGISYNAHARPSDPDFKRHQCVIERA